MAIIGIESVLYGVHDVAESTRYFIDFGLPLVDRGMCRRENLKRSRRARRSRQL
jgi:hypothetical protein